MLLLSYLLWPTAYSHLSLHGSRSLSLMILLDLLLVLPFVAYGVYIFIVACISLGCYSSVCILTLIYLLSLRCHGRCLSYSLLVCLCRCAEHAGANKYLHSAGQAKGNAKESVIENEFAEIQHWQQFNDYRVETGADSAPL